MAIKLVKKIFIIQIHYNVVFKHLQILKYSILIIFTHMKMIKLFFLKNTNNFMNMKLYSFIKKIKNVILKNNLNKL
ncbi:MAG: hypothetical protein PWP28_1707 [Oceanotoga sp.]|jgi:hypothetical protein|nr:hypothetical protein [Oceanotoga sp.]